MPRPKRSPRTCDVSSPDRMIFKVGIVGNSLWGDRVKGQRVRFFEIEEERSIAGQLRAIDKAHEQAADSSRWVSNPDYDTKVYPNLAEEPELLRAWSLSMYK